MLHKMRVTEMTYPVSGKRKFSVIYNGNEYICYTHPFMAPGYTVSQLVAKDGNYKDITGTLLASEIFLNCL